MSTSHSSVIANVAPLAALPLPQLPLLLIPPANAPLPKVLKRCFPTRYVLCSQDLSALFAFGLFTFAAISFCFIQKR